MHNIGIPYLIHRLARAGTDEGQQITPKMCVFWTTWSLSLNLWTLSVLTHWPLQVLARWGKLLVNGC